MTARRTGKPAKRRAKAHPARPIPKAKARPKPKPKALRKAASRTRKAKRSAVPKRAQAVAAVPKQAAAPKPRAAASRGPARAKTPRLERERRILDETVPTPPSSLDLDRTSSAARTGRAELLDSLEKHGQGVSPALTAGDVDADWERAYFDGDEAPGGDNPTPDQEVVDDIGKALGVQYEDNEELKASDKIGERDKHRWELDPASSDDYDDR